jgi:hypothetical protein
LTGAVTDDLFGPDEDSEEDLSALNAAATSQETLAATDQEDLFSTFAPDEEEDIEADRINDPSIAHLEEPPIIGGRGRDSDLFGARAESPIGRALSPRLYSQAAQFPTCTQLRVWKYENGQPIGLGAIDAMATEEDFCRSFYDAMPRRGEGRCQYRLRPIDINGAELGQEVTLWISEHHAAMQHIRRMKALEAEEGSPGAMHYGSRYDPEEREDSNMAGIMERMMRSTDRRAEILEAQLEEERNILRTREEGRMQDQVDMATNAAQGVQVLTDRMMKDESQRSERAMKRQTEQSQMLLTTLTSIFAQQQTMQQGAGEAARRADEYRLEQERQRAGRERQEADAQRQRERLEMEDRRRREQEEHGRKMTQEREYVERRLLKETKDMEIRVQREREEMQMRLQREGAEREARERWFSEERSRRETVERETSRSRDQDRQRQHERMMRELEVQQQRDREHAERMMILSKQEISNRAMGGLTDMLPKAAGFLSSMGVEPSDVVQRIFSPPAPPEPESGGWSETLPKLLGAGAEIAKAAIQSRSGIIPPVMGQPAPLEDYAEVEAYDAEEMYRARQRTMQGRMRTAEVQAAHNPDGEPIPNPDGSINFRQTKLYTPEEPAAPDPIQTAGNAGLSLREQKQVRNSLSGLVRHLSQAPQEEWEGHIVAGLTESPSIYSYIRAVTVRNAIRETGADPTLTENIVGALQRSELVPRDLPYGE